MTGGEDVRHALAALPSGATCAVIGAPGTGKTRAVQHADRHGAFRRRVVFDPYALTDRREASRGRLVTPWPGVLVTPRGLLECPEVLDREPLAVVVAPETDEPAQLGRDFQAVCRLAWSTGDVDVIAEEAGLYGREAARMVQRLASGGRHVGVRLVLLSQSVTRLPIEARRYLSHVVAFAQGEPADVANLRQRCGRKFAARVQALRVGGPPEFWRLGDALE